ncbi:MAG: HTH-type transcriptional regulator BetI [Pseudomonadales bacterium]|nr:HTH-type transcriptional regulator BetI [Pseudomonadales bacterium]
MAREVIAVEAAGGVKKRAHVRREQVLDAATACFRRHGFHAASMAEISREAGMSVGHIYHYFSGKEAIIAAIVEREQQEILEIDDGIRSQPDLGRALVEHAPRGLQRALDGASGPLLLEVLAEAARNPAIAAMVREADAEVRRRIGSTLLAATAGSGELADLQGRLEVLGALFGGLAIRAVRNPGLDRESTARAMQRVIGALLEP